MIDRSVAARVTQILPFTEPVTLGVRQYDGQGVATDTYRDYPLAKARFMDTRNAKSAFPMNPEVLAVNARVWELYKPVLDAVNAPEPGKDDRITSGPASQRVTWVVQEIVDDLNGNVFRCLCTKAV